MGQRVGTGRPMLFLNLQNYEFFADNQSEKISSHRIECKLFEWISGFSDKQRQNCRLQGNLPEVKYLSDFRVYRKGCESNYTEDEMETFQSILTKKKILTFKDVTKELIPELKSLFDRYPSRSCDFSLAGIMMWREYFKYSYAVSDNTFFLKGESPDSGTTLFYSPVGELADEEGIERIRQYCAATATQGNILISEDCFEEENCVASNPLEYVDEWKEYLYDIGKFIGFPGKKMEKKRNHLNFFLNHYDFAIEEISDNNIDQLIAFTKKFGKTHEGDPLLDYENRKTIEALTDFNLYPYEGIAVRVEGEIAGYTFGEHIGDTFFAHVEKGDICYRGIYQALASKMAEHAKRRHPETRWLNREEDMGSDDLRRSKMSYHPAGFVRKRLIMI